METGLPLRALRMGSLFYAGRRMLTTACMRPTHVLPPPSRPAILQPSQATADSVRLNPARYQDGTQARSQPTPHAPVTASPPARPDPCTSGLRHANGPTRRNPDTSFCFPSRTSTARPSSTSPLKHVNTPPPFTCTVCCYPTSTKKVFTGDKKESYQGELVETPPTPAGQLVRVPAQGHEDVERGLQSPL